jgi:hypothetical protein
VKQVEPEFELTRLSESNDPALTRAIAGLREHQPDITELASLASHLAVRGITVTAPEAIVDAASAAWKKWVLLGGGAASGLALWFALREPAVALLGIQGRPQPSASAPAVEATAHRRALGAPRLSLPLAPVEATASATSAPLVREERAETMAAPESPAPRLVPTATAASADTLRREPSAPALSGTAAARPAEPAVSNAVVEGPTEIELLRDARLALRQSPTRALELVESHARAFPNGKLVQERELIAISALVALARRTAALSRASRFEQTFPTSPYRKQIGDLLR